MSAYYVTATDITLTHSRNANGKIYKVIFKCDSLEDAGIVLQKAQKCEHLSFVGIAKRISRYYADNYSIEYRNKKTHSEWYLKEVRNAS